MDQKRELIKKRLNRVFQEVFENDRLEISEMVTANDIDEWDSLTHVVLVMAVEKEFGLRLTAVEVGKLENVGAMISVLAERATK